MKNNKNLKKLLIALLICLILICVLLVLINSAPKEEETPELVDGIHTQEDLNIIQDDVANYLSDKITPKGMSRMYGKYKGDNEFSDLYRSLYVLVNYLPTLSSLTGTSDVEINQYYTKNSSEIENKLGITTSEDFSKFIGYLTETNYRGEKFLECKIDSSTFSYLNNYFSFNLEFIFEDFDSEFTIGVHFANSEVAKPEVYYTVIEGAEEKTVVENTIAENTIVENTVNV